MSQERFFSADDAMLAFVGQKSEKGLTGVAAGQFQSRVQKVRAHRGFSGLSVLFKRILFTSQIISYLRENASYCFLKIVVYLSHSDVPRGCARVTSVKAPRARVFL